MSDRSWGVCLFWIGFIIGMLFVGVLICVNEEWQDEVEPPDTKQIEFNSRLDAIDEEYKEAWDSLEELSAVLDRLEEQARKVNQ